MTKASHNTPERPILSRTPKLFRQSDVTRAIKAAVAAGIAVGRVGIAPDGSITIMAAEVARPEPTSALDKWMAGRDADRA